MVHYIINGSLPMDPFWARWIQCTFSHPISLKIRFTIILLCTSASHKRSLAFRFTD